MPWEWRLRFAEVAVTAQSGAEPSGIAYRLTTRLEVPADENSVRLNPDLPIANQYQESPTWLSPAP